MQSLMSCGSFKPEGEAEKSITKITEVNSQFTLFMEAPEWFTGIFQAACHFVSL